MRGLLRAMALAFVIGYLLMGGIFVALFLG